MNFCNKSLLLPAQLLNTDVTKMAEILPVAFRKSKHGYDTRKTFKILYIVNPINALSDQLQAYI